MPGWFKGKERKGDDMSETKTPQPGEWWQRTVPVRGVINARFFIVGPSYDGKLIGMRQWLPMEEKDESDFRYGILDGTESIEHLPDCTGWDWEPETWPKYYVLDEKQGTCDRPWYIKRTSEYRCTRFGINEYGKIESEEQSFREQSPLWLEVTEAEALSRVKPAPATTKRLPVRLWVYRGEGSQMVYANNKTPSNGGFVEVKFDGTQFYIEETT